MNWLLVSTVILSLCLSIAIIYICFLQLEIYKLKEREKHGIRIYKDSGFPLEYKEKGMWKRYKIIDENEEY